MFHYPNFQFEIQKTSKNNKARLGRLRTPHGAVETPAFIFCATKAAIKGATPQQIDEAETQIILSNTYHLMLQPGGEIIERQGGLHRFMGWNKPMLTDSGGFQIFSLGHGSVASEIKGKRLTNRPKTLLKITEEGAQFKSYIDGRMHLLTPERSIQVQRQLGADLIVVLDECTPFHVDKIYTQRSMHLSHRWALRSLAEFQRTDNQQQALYGIIQGGVYNDLRRESTQFVNDHPFFGHAVGGSLGASKDQMHDIVALTMSLLDPARPVHLLGIGGVSDIFNGVRQGIDTFDCVHPTRLARHGGALVQPSFWLKNEGKGGEHINLRNARFREDSRPIDEACPCSTCKIFSRSYLHHLLRAQEILALQAITIHNISFMNRLLSAIRRAIAEDRLDDEEKNWVFVK
ncbi:MAG: tRNA guanosine(34) transglycosylase Tgt [Candidatus Paracaedimonas acanthamoebae]|uniref:Queuine tRNA-ribosyltransferase n=1 Tax=Candidatus Paracaedimonas acanthamoebae TaxID=244581 RepID=A0A8J7PIQ4_9PROT|nr:tRNA guanosine(34) transglycosylase Tgt [Candidatus Paracaedimonas acanthamoebae]